MVGCIYVQMQFSSACRHDSLHKAHGRWGPSDCHTSIELDACELVSDQGAHALSRQCAALVKVSLAGLERVSDASVECIAQSCRQLVDINLDDTDLTNAGAQLLAESCRKLQHASVGGTYVTSVGAEVLAQRRSLAQASAAWNRPVDWHRHVERQGALAQARLCLYRLDVTDAYVESLRARFPDLHVFP